MENVTSHCRICSSALSLPDHTPRCVRWRSIGSGIGFNGNPPPLPSHSPVVPLCSIHSHPSSSFTIKREKIRQRGRERERCNSTCDHGADRRAGQRAGDQRDKEHEGNEGEASTCRCISRTPSTILRRHNHPPSLHRYLMQGAPAAV